MAKSLSLKTVVEGVETKGVAIMLANMQCNYAQGYYWSKALCEADFINFAQKNINNKA